MLQSRRVNLSAAPPPAPSCSRSLSLRADAAGLGLPSPGLAAAASLAEKAYSCGRVSACIHTPSSSLQETGPLNFPDCMLCDAKM